MKINMRNWQNSILEAKEIKAFPIMTYPGLALIGKQVKDVVTNAETQFRCIDALAKKYPSIAIPGMMDLSVEAEAFGSAVKFSADEVPTVVGSIVNDQEDAAALPVPPVGAARTSIYLKAIETAAQKAVDRPVFGGHIGPFSLAGRLIDMTEIMVATIAEPDMVHETLKKCTEFLIAYSKSFKAAGANGVIIAEPAAGLLSPGACDEFSSQYIKQIISAVQDDDFMVILHNCGNTVKLVNSMLSTGAQGLHFGNAVKLTEILPQVPKGRLAFGNINPAVVFKNGTVPMMQESVQQLLEEMKGYENFVLSSGCDIPPGTSIENMDAFFGTLAEFNSRK